MPSTSHLSQPTIVSLPRLLRQIATGDYRIPRFQRPFVWKDEQRLLLLDSIKQGLPIGSILVWATSEHTLEEHQRLGPFRLPAARADGVHNYVIDGHQRFVTLYSALTQPDPWLVAHPSDEYDDGGGVRWPIYYDLEREEFRLAQQHRRPRDEWMPLSLMMDPALFYEYQKTLVAKGLKQLAGHSEGVATRFREYNVPVVVLFTEDLGIAIECFRRVNSSGTPMSEAHMLNAITCSRKFDFRRLFHEIKDGMAPLGWANMDDQILVDALKVVSNHYPHYATPEDLFDEDLDLEWFREHVTHAAEFLATRCGVFGPEALPYPLQFVLLCAAAFCRRGPIEESSGTEMERWFWRTTFSESFTGYSHFDVFLAVTDVYRTVLGSGSVPHEYPATITPHTHFHANSVRSRALALLLARRDPLDPNGQPFEAARMLADLGADAVPKIIPAGDLPDGTDGPENRWVMHPRKLEAMRDLLRSSLDPRRDAILASHVINREASDRYARGDLRGFLDIRRRDLIAMERDFVESLGLSYAERGDVSAPG